MRLRQVALVARELEPVTSDLEDVLDVDAGYRDPGVGEFGLHNSVMAVGDTFLEVVSPLRDDTTAGRYLERRGGDGGYMVILQLDDLDEARARIVWKADLPDIRGTHLHPKDVGGAILSLDWADPPGSWRWAGPEWEKARGAAGGREISAVDVAAVDPEAMAARWAEVLDRKVDDGPAIALDRGEIRFVFASRPEGEGVVGIDVAGLDPDGAMARARTRGLLVEGDAVSAAGIAIRFPG